MFESGNCEAKRHPWADEVNMFPQPLPGVANETIVGLLPGRARFQGSYWPAKLYNRNTRTVLNPGQRLLVVGIENITLLVISWEG